MYKINMGFMTFMNNSNFLPISGKQNILDYTNFKPVPQISITLMELRSFSIKSYGSPYS